VLISFVTLLKAVPPEKTERTGPKLREDDDVGDDGDVANVQSLVDIMAFEQEDPASYCARYM
jgi:hypothetical protein